MTRHLVILKSGEQFWFGSWAAANDFCSQQNEECWIFEVEV